jgi:predicted Zn-dependent protease with MMP-like domain
MNDFPTIEEVNDMLDKIATEIPAEFFNKLNEGVVLLEKYKIHPESRERDKLYIMGEYSRSVTGRNIKIYYGSFKNVYRGISNDALYENLKHTLLHEFTHHLESLSGERGLEVKDSTDMKKYKNRS